MSGLTRPIEIEEGNEREQLITWDWDHEEFTADFDKVAAKAAATVLDQIKEEACLFLSASDDGTGVRATVNLFGDYFLTFDISDDLKLMHEGISTLGLRKPWVAETTRQQNLAALLRSIADKIDCDVQESQADGTLDEEKGMSYSEWRATEQDIEP